VSIFPRRNTRSCRPKKTRPEPTVAFPPLDRPDIISQASEGNFGSTYPQPKQPPHGYQPLDRVLPSEHCELSLHHMTNPVQ
jgi:hypothetical protein